MSQKLNTTIAVIGIDIGKNSFAFAEFLVGRRVTRLRAKSLLTLSPV